MLSEAFERVWDAVRRAQGQPAHGGLHAGHRPRRPGDDSGRNCMSHDDSIPLDLLVKLPIFENLNDTERQQLADIASTMNFTPGEIVLRQGKSSQNLWVVLEGKCEVIKHTPGLTAGDAKATSCWPSSAEFDHFGEMSFFHAAPHSASVKATTQREAAAHRARRLRRPDSRREHGRLQAGLQHRRRAWPTACARWTTGSWSYWLKTPPTARPRNGTASATSYLTRGICRAVDVRSERPRCSDVTVHLFCPNGAFFQPRA